MNFLKQHKRFLIEMLILYIIWACLLCMGCATEDYFWDATIMARELQGYNCAKRVALMKSKYPDLKIVHGWYQKTAHCWLQTENGDIVDPSLYRYDKKLYKIRYIENN